MRRFIASSVALVAVITSGALIAGVAPAGPQETAAVEMVAAAQEGGSVAVTEAPATTTTTSTTTTTIDLGPPCEWNDQILAFDPACVPPPPPTTAKPKPKPKPAPPPPPPAPEPEPVVEEAAPEPQVPHEPPSGDRIWAHLASIRQCESGGNYQAVSKSGKFRGAYQFMQSTWNSIARISGRGDLSGVDPRSASPADQDAMAYALYVNSGPGQWPQCQYR